MTHPPIPPAHGGRPRPGAIPRRRFLTKAAAAVIGAVVALVPLVVGLVFFLDPLWRRRRKRASGEGDANFVRVVAADRLTTVPQKFEIRMDRRDAWNFYRDQRVGNVVLRKRTEGEVASADDVIAFSDVCPHLGCTVDIRKKAEGESPVHYFLCPCHASAFQIDGERTNTIPPRGLDPLPVEIREGRGGKEVWVNYLRFESGRHEREVI